MSYRILPPGSTLFWRIGILSPLTRWALTISTCLVLIVLWYGATRFLFSNSSQQAVRMPCATQLAALVPHDVQSMSIDALNQTNPSLLFLNVCDQHGLTVQSCACLAPTTKNNVTVQRVHVVCTGTLVQIKGLLQAISVSSLPISRMEITLKQQQDKRYIGNLSADCMLLCM